MFADGSEAVTEVSDAGEDDTLGEFALAWSASRCGILEKYFGGIEVGGSANPIDFVANFFNGIDEGPDVTAGVQD